MSQQTLWIRGNEGQLVIQLNEDALIFSQKLKETFSNDAIYAIHNENNPYVVEDLGDKNLKIIVKYLNLCAIRKSELPAPTTPLPRLTMPSIFGDEYYLFQDIFDSDMTDKERMKQLCKFSQNVSYFQIPEFTKKVCASIAFIITGTPKHMLGFLLEDCIH
jgi:hypothetical protein